MPLGLEARRRAAVAELRSSLAAISCALRLLEPTAASARERQLIEAITAELERAERAVQRCA